MSLKWPIPRSELRRLFYYRHEDGALVWRNNNKKVGTRFNGRRSHFKYQAVLLRCPQDPTGPKRWYRLSHLIWAWHFDEWPAAIWHWDTDEQNNKLTNLIAGQNRYARPNTATGRAGISRVVVRKKEQIINGFSARIYVDGRTKFLGIYPTYEKACDVLDTAIEVYDIDRSDHLFEKGMDRFRRAIKENTLGDDF